MAADSLQAASVTRRVRVEYFDQNEAFAPRLPRSGGLVGQCADVHGNQDWFLMKLDEPFDYQRKVGGPFRFRLVPVEHFLLRSRGRGAPWPGGWVSRWHEVGHRSGPGGRPSAVPVILGA